MSTFYIHDIDQAMGIVKAYEQCGNCSNCPLNSPEGWRCDYLYKVATDYINNQE